MSRRHVVDLLTVDEPTHMQHRIYPKEVMRRALGQYQARIDREGPQIGFGYYAFQRPGGPRIRDATHFVNSVFMVGDIVKAEIEIIEGTDATEGLETLLKRELITFCVAGKGKIEESEDGVTVTAYILENVAWDAIRDKTSNHESPSEGQA